MKYTMMKRFARSVAGLLLAVSLASCGGGGGDSGCNPYEGCNPTDGTATAQQLRMTLTASNVTNGSLDDVVVTVTALDSSSRAVPNADIEYSVADSSTVDEDAGAYIGQTVPTTDAQGKSTATVSLGTDKSNRVVTVTATAAGGVVVSKDITIRGSKIEASGQTLVDPGAQESITFAVQDSNGAGQPNVPVLVQSSGLGTQSGNTDSSGVFTYSYTVPNSPGGTLVFTASAAGVTRDFEVSVKQPAQVLPPPDLTGNVTPSLQVNPNVVAVNTAGSEANKMQVVASFESLARLPIANMRVSFRLDGPTASAVGGKFSNGPITGTPVAYTGTDGKVQVFYIPGTSSSPNNQISVKACYGATDAEALNCTGSSMSQAFTIADEAVSVSIGTDGLLLDEDASLSYAQRFVIKVVNSAGQPKSGLTVSAQINTVNYFKGYFAPVSGGGWTNLSRTFRCAKEDLDDDDRLDTSPANEDLDFDAKLEPVRADVSLIATNGWTTNAEGVVIVKMSYPKNVATWMTVNLQATALVGGSEGRASRQQILYALQKDLDADAAPAFVDSPYGVVINDVTLTADRLMPNGTTTVPSGTTLTPCRNPD